jgi:hypothetical protein
VARTKTDVTRSASDMSEATAALRKALQMNQRAVDKTAQLLEAGESCTRALEIVDAARHRSEVTACMDDYEAARHRIRLAVFKSCLAEGTSISEVGRLLSISRQLASRLAAEVDGG